MDISLKKINKLALPALIAGITEPILSLTDAAIIGNTNTNATEALAAIGIVTTFLSMLVWVLGQTRSAISSIISQYLGANNLKAVKSLPAQAITIVTVISVLIILTTYPFSEFIFKFYNATNTVLKYSVNYYNIRVFGFPFTMITIAVFGIFRGLQNTYYPMLIAITGTIINIVFDLILVYGIDNLVAPMHIEGAALASIIAQVTMAALSIALLLKKTTIPIIPKLPLNPELKTFSKIIANLFIRTLALNVTLYFGSSFATRYGNTYIAAYTIAINLWFLGAFLIDGYASAGNILSGKLFGAKHYKLLLTLSNKLIKYGLIFGAFIAMVGFIFYKPIGLIFTKEPEVLNHFYDVFWVILLMQPICALAFIFDGIFKGLGKVSHLRNVLLLSTGLVFIPVLLIFDHFNYKLFGILIAFTLWMLARGIPLIIIFRRIFNPLAQKD